MWADWEGKYLTCLGLPTLRAERTKWGDLGMAGCTLDKVG